MIFNDNLCNLLCKIFLFNILSIFNVITVYNTEFLIMIQKNHNLNNL